MCFSERKRERERSIFALCEYKSNLLPWRYIFSILYFPNTTFTSGFGYTAPPSGLRLQSCAPLTTSGQTQASLQDQGLHLTEIFIFWCLCQHELLTELGRGRFRFLRPLIWQVLKCSVPISMAFFFFPPKEPPPVLTLCNSKPRLVHIHLALHSPGSQSTGTVFLLILFLKC